MNTVTLFVDSSGIGGIETHIINVSKALEQNAIPVQILLWQRYHGERHIIEDRLCDTSIPVRYVDGSIKALRHYVGTEQVLHCHGYKANIIGKLGHVMGWWHAVPTHHNGDIGKGKVRLYVTLDELTSKFFSPISVSQEIHNRLGGRGIKLKNFVDYQENQSSSVTQQSIPKIAFVGRLSEEKNPDAFCKLAKQFVHANCEFHVYGDGELLDTLKARYEHVTFHGQVDMNEAWEEIDLLCITSKTEGLPLAALEAMSRGIPIASFAVGDLSELIKEGRNGWLVSPDDIQGMVKAIEQWLSLLPYQAAGMMYQAEQTIKNEYSQNAILPTLLSHYRLSEHK